jgi:hypothetical protein
VFQVSLVHCKRYFYQMVYMYHVNLCRLQGIHIVDLLSKRVKDACSDICTQLEADGG